MSVCQQVILKLALHIWLTHICVIQLGCRQTSNVSHTLDSRLEQRLTNNILILDLTPGFNALGKFNCKTRRGTFKCCDLVWLILEAWWYVNFPLWKKRPFIVGCCMPAWQVGVVWVDCYTVQALWQSDLSTGSPCRSKIFNQTKEGLQAVETA